MKVNKKVVCSLLIGSFLLTSGGLAVADDTIKREIKVRMPMQGKMINEDGAPACWQVFDELAAENKLTPEQANLIKEAMQEKMNEQQAVRRQLGEEQINTNLEALINDGTINSAQANAIKNHLQNGFREPQLIKAEMMNPLQGLIDEGILTSEKAEQIINYLKNNNTERPFLDNAKLDELVSKNIITSQEASDIKTHWQTRANERPGKMKGKQNLFKELVDQGVLTQEQADAAVQKICRFQ